MRAQRLGKLDLGAGTQTPQTAMSLADEVNILRQQVKNLTRENRRLKEENEFLEEASAFFAASRRKSAKASDDLIKRDFTAEAPLKKCITDITEIKAADGKLYVSAIFDCFDVAVVGLAMADNMRADLCVETLVNAYRTYPDLRGCIIHSDRGSQYTGEIYRNAISKYGIIQSMNSAGGRCHDNARCESMWARLKEELLYGRYNTEKLTIKDMILPNIGVYCEGLSLALMCFASFVILVMHPPLMA